MAKNVDSDVESKIQWLYPELMTKDGLVEILKQRYIHKHGLKKMAKEELLELYYKYIIPLPQRKYRQNRRGKEMTKKQISMAKKRKTYELDENEPIIKKPYTETSSEPVPKFSCSAAVSEMSNNESRLKPPPSCINYDRKSIKLSSVAESPAEDMPKTDDKTKKGFNKITFSSPSSSATTEPLESPLAKSRPRVDTNTSKTIQLINKTITFSENAEGDVKRTKKKDDSLDFEIKTFVKKEKPVKVETSEAENISNNNDTCTSLKKRPSDSELMEEEPKKEEVKKKKIKIKRISV